MATSAVQPGYSQIKAMESSLCAINYPPLRHYKVWSKRGLLGRQNIKRQSSIMQIIPHCIDLRNKSLGRSSHLWNETIITDDYLEKSGQELCSPIGCPLLVYNFNVLLVCSSQNVTPPCSIIMRVRLHQGDHLSVSTQRKGKLHISRQGLRPFQSPLYRPSLKSTLMYTDLKGFVSLREWTAANCPTQGTCFSLPSKKTINISSHLYTAPHGVAHEEKPEGEVHKN